jgi:cytochrome c5
MIRKTFVSRFAFAAAALALSACGGKKEEPAEPVAPDAVEGEVAPKDEGETPAPQGSELTKVTSQGQAAAQGRGVFVRAAEGEPEAVYLARCQYCHIELGPGTITLARRLGPEDALLANRTDLTEDYIKVVVRNGLNTMPALTRVEVSDAELDLIAQYLTRNNAADE